MRADERFLNQPKHFWAHVRSISEKIGYTARRTKQIRVPTIAEMAAALESLGLGTRHLATESGKPTPLGRSLVAYFEFRAALLNHKVEPLLMDSAAASRLYNEVKRRTKSSLTIPMNKQKGKKRKPAYFTAIINMLIAENLRQLPCDFSPRRLTTFTQGSVPLRTLARWVDGAFPGAVNPIAVWEIKEYYYTTTFGSRVADGVYETLLDGMELEELRVAEGVRCRHYLMVDSHYTWWKCGRSYLCRLIDMLHMGYVDEVLFGREVVDRLPRLVREWAREYRASQQR